MNQAKAKAFVSISVQRRNTLSLVLRLASLAFLFASQCSGQITGLVAQGYSECTYALDSEGVLFAWGKNESGQLANGINSNQTVETYPQWVPTPGGVTNWVAAAGGTSCTFALDQSGQLFACGDNSFLQLGLGSVGNQGYLQQVPFPPSVTRWTAVAGGNTTLAIADTGALYGWGTLSLTNPPLSYVGSPVLIPLPTNAVNVAAGRSHNLVLAADGKLYAWGQNDAGQVGVGYISPVYSITNVLQVIRPAGVTRWLRACGGGFHSFGIGDDRQLYVWGANNFGQLGIGSSMASVATPTLVAFPVGVTNWLQITAGEYHSVALGGTGRIYSWGVNINGILGTGSTTNEFVPIEVPRPPGVGKWLAVTAGRFHTMGLGDDGQLYSWGYGQFGILGNGTNTLFQTTPTRVLFRPTVQITKSSPQREISARAPSGLRWALQSSSNLVSWVSVATNTAHRGEVAFQWTNSMNEAATFFRISQDL